MILFTSVSRIAEGPGASREEMLLCMNSKMSGNAVDSICVSGNVLCFKIHYNAIVVTKQCCYVLNPF
jgi:hypothetical protein